MQKNTERMLGLLDIIHATKLSIKKHQIKQFEEQRQKEEKIKAQMAELSGYEKIIKLKFGEALIGDIKRIFGNPDYYDGNGKFFSGNDQQIRVEGVFEISLPPVVKEHYQARNVITNYLKETAKEHSDLLGISQNIHIRQSVLAKIGNADFVEAPVANIFKRYKLQKEGLLQMQINYKFNLNSLLLERSLNPVQKDLPPLIVKDLNNSKKAYK